MIDLVNENSELKKALQKEKNMVQYLLGEAIMVLSDRNEFSPTEEVADLLRDELLDDLWRFILSDDQLKLLRKNVPSRISIAFIEMEEMKKTINRLTKELEECKNDKTKNV